MTKRTFACGYGNHDVALVDGYGVGDTLLEGVMFECRFGDDGKIVVNIQKECAEYFSGLNQEKWLKAVTEAVNDETFDSFLTPDGKSYAWVDSDEPLERERIKIYGRFEIETDGTYLISADGNKMAIGPAPSFNLSQQEVEALSGKPVVCEIDIMSTVSDGESVQTQATITTMTENLAQPVEAPVVASGVGTVEADPDNPDELLIVFPPGLLEKAGLKAGDNVIWTTHADETGKVTYASLTKKI